MPLRMVACTRLPTCKPDTLRRLLGAICLVSLGLCGESSFRGATGRVWRGQGKAPTGSSRGRGEALFPADPRVARSRSTSLSTAWP